MTESEGWIPIVGEEVIHLPSGTKFTLKRRTKTQDGTIYLWHNSSSPYPLNECCSPSQLDRPLNGDELATLLQVAVVAIESRATKEMELFAALLPHQKQQFWLSIPEEVRSGLWQLGQVAKEAA